MVAPPMRGDGPLATEIFEDDPPVTLGELVSTADNNFDLLHALAMSRAWPEGMPERDLEPWQRVGPDILWMVNRQDYCRVQKIGDETIAYLGRLRWVARKKLTRPQLERATTDAIKRLTEGDCMPASLACLAAGLRKETYLDLRAEATAFLLNCWAVAEFGVQVALGMRPEPESTLISS